MYNYVKAQNVVASIFTLLLSVYLGLMGCTSEPKMGSTSKSSDIQPPIELVMSILEDSLVLHSSQHMSIAVVSLLPVERLNCAIQSSGIVSITSDKQYSWNQVGQNDTLVFKSNFSLASEGEGALRVSAQAMNNAGDTLYGRAETLYFLADEGYLLMNSSSPLLLRRQLLNHLLESDKITQSEYEEQLERLLGQGAIEESHISVDSQ